VSVCVSLRMDTGVKRQPDREDQTQRVSRIAVADLPVYLATTCRVIESKASC